MGREGIGGNLFFFCFIPIPKVSVFYEARKKGGNGWMQINPTQVM